MLFLACLPAHYCPMQLRFSPRLRQGFLLLEVLIGMAIFAVFIGGVSWVMLNGQESTDQAVDQERGAYFAEGALEIARTIRDQDFDLLTAGGPFGYRLQSGRWELYGTEAVTDGYHTSLMIAPIVAGKRVRVTATTRWDFGTKRAGEVTLTAELSNWRVQREWNDWEIPTIQGSWGPGGPVTLQPTRSIKQAIAAFFTRIGTAEAQAASPQFRDVITVGSYAYATTSDRPGMYVFDITNADTPTRVASSFQLPGTLVGGQMVLGGDGYIYVIAYPASNPSYQSSILRCDVVLPTDPVCYSVYSFEGITAYALAMDQSIDETGKQLLYISTAYSMAAVSSASSSSSSSSVSSASPSSSSAISSGGSSVVSASSAASETERSTAGSNSSASTSSSSSFSSFFSSIPTSSSSSNPSLPSSASTSSTSSGFTPGSLASLDAFRGPSPRMGFIASLLQRVGLVRREPTYFAAAIDDVESSRAHSSGGTSTSSGNSSASSVSSGAASSASSVILGGTNPEFWVVDPNAGVALSVLQFTGNINGISVTNHEPTGKQIAALATDNIMMEYVAVDVTTSSAVAFEAGMGRDLNSGPNDGVDGLSIIATNTGAMLGTAAGVTEELQALNLNTSTIPPLGSTGVRTNEAGGAIMSVDQDPLGCYAWLATTNPTNEFQLFLRTTTPYTRVTFGTSVNNDFDGPLVKLRYAPALDRAVAVTSSTFYVISPGPTPNTDCAL